MANPNWKKGGPSPNPKGRPRKGSSFAEILRQVADEEVTDANGTKMSRAEAISRKLVSEAFKGEAWAIREIMDRIDGKPVQSVISDNENRIVVEREVVDDSQAPD